jgi:DNA-binding GntR family transcriptional regulator
MSSPAFPPRAGERVYGVLKSRLLDGRYRGGERLNADELAAELDVSRQPVFDAFKRLSTEGFVTVKPQVGCRVAVYEMADVRDYFALFGAVEGTASALAAQRRTPADLKALRRLHAQIGGLVELTDGSERAQGYRALNRDFHSRIHSMCGTPIVETFGAGMYDRADFFINGSASVSPFADALAERQDDHARIVAALEAGDPDAARTAASEHILGTVALIERAVEQYGPRAAA